VLTKSYSFKKIYNTVQDITSPMHWKEIEPLEIEFFRWMNNDYKPKVIVKACYSSDFIYVKFLVYEKKVTVRFLKNGDPVFKDSCVEFFINLFPVEVTNYFNIEFNAIGTIKMGYGIKRERIYLQESDLSSLKIVTSIKEPVKGYHGSEFWELYCAIPINILEKLYNKKFIGGSAIGNFYKCGDETEFKHYGMWNLVNNTKPDFHLPEYFGNFYFME